MYELYKTAKQHCDIRSFAQYWIAYKCITCEWHYTRCIISYNLYTGPILCMKMLKALNSQ